MRKIIVISLLIFFSNKANAICQRPPPKLCEVFFNSDLVVHGIVTNATYGLISDKNDPDNQDYGWRYGVSVIKSYKGAKNNKILVESPNGSNSVTLNKNKEYIMFLNNNLNNTYDIYDNCEGLQGTNGEPYTPMLETEIHSLLLKKTSRIEIEVRHKNWDLASGVNIKISSNGLLETVTTNRGQASLEVAAGKYMIKAPTHYIESSYSSKLSNEQSVLLSPGQCTQIQFQESQ
jgi:hypothetical protein